MKIIRKSIYIFIVTFTVMLLLQGCVKKEPESTLTQVFFAPLVPNAPLVNFSLNGELRATQVGYSTTVGTVRYTLPYFSMEAKTGVNITYNNQTTNTPIASITQDLGDEKAYSTFLIDSFSKARMVIVNDNLNLPTPGFVKVRFFHFSPNAPTVNVNILGSTTNLWSNRSLETQATASANEAFIEIPAGNYSFEIRLASSGAVAYTIPVQNLLTDRIYTIAARGFVGGVGSQALGAWVYPNLP